MAVFRIEKNKNYTVMANYHLRDISLSLKAKGLLSLMLSLPDGWDYTTKGLACICKDGVDSICSTVKELEKAGYVQRRRLRNELGHLTEIEYTILEKPVRTASSEESALPDSSAKAGTPPKREKPVLDYPVLDNPEQAIPEQDNPAQLNIQESITEKSNTDLSSKDYPFRCKAQKDCSIIGRNETACRYCPSYAERPEDFGHGRTNCWA